MGAWTVTFGTARRGLGGLQPRPVPSSLCSKGSNASETVREAAVSPNPKLYREKTRDRQGDRRTNKQTDKQTEGYRRRAAPDLRAGV